MLVNVNEYYGGDAKEVQQVNTDAQTHDESYQNKPAVAVSIVCTVFPFQYEPEHESRTH